MRTKIEFVVIHIEKVPDDSFSRFAQEITDTITETIQDLEKAKKDFSVMRTDVQYISENKTSFFLAYKCTVDD